MTLAVTIVSKTTGIKVNNAGIAVPKIQARPNVTPYTKKAVRGKTYKMSVGDSARTRKTSALKGLAMHKLINQLRQTPTNPTMILIERSCVGQSEAKSTTIVSVALSLG